MATGPLISEAELRKWLRYNAPEPDDAEGMAFMHVVIDAASLLVRQYGSKAWVTAPAGAGEVEIPAQAQLIATLLAKNYIENPEGVQSGTYGPISERKIDDVLRGLQLSEEEKAILAELAGQAIPDDGAGTLFIINSSAGPDRRKPDTIFVPAVEPGQPMSDWGFPMWAADDFGAPVS